LDKFLKKFQNKVSSDIISTLVNIFGDPLKFIEQYRRMLSERCVLDFDFKLENEIKNLEMLKIRFGEIFLHNCDVIIKDLKDSIKINDYIKSEDKNNMEFNCLIISKNCWPFKIDDINKNPFNEGADNMLTRQLAKFSNKYTKIKNSRALEFYTNMGYVDLTLSFENGTFNFKVSQLAALIIDLFDDQYKGNVNINYFKFR